MHIQVYIPERKAKMRAHTATHLLHAALHEYLGTTKQAWSLVDHDYLRFDFSCKQALSKKDLRAIEQRVNAWIYASFPVTTQELPYEDAITAWAKAFFEDTYGEHVRMVSIHSSEDEEFILHSLELCWWTHVQATDNIWAFKILQHTSVASGIRRIEAVTWIKVAKESRGYEQRLEQIAQKLDVQAPQVESKLEKTLKNYEQLLASHQSLQEQSICRYLDTLDGTCTLAIAWDKRWKWHIINTSSSHLSTYTFKDIVHHAKTKRSDRNRILYNNEGNFAIYIWTQSMSAKIFAKKHNLKWGWSDVLVQGKDLSIISLVW